MSYDACVCGEQKPTYRAHCSWACAVSDAREKGSIDLRPNGLPVKCITAAGYLLECEHGDHPDYIAPVEVGYIGPIEKSHRDDYQKLTGRYPEHADITREMYDELHAVIYCDGNVIVTLHECCYSMWSVRNGKCLGGNLTEKNMWQIKELSLRKFLEIYDAKKKNQVLARSIEEKGPADQED